MQPFDRQVHDLRRLDQVKRVHRPAGAPLGAEMVSFFKHSVAKRHTRLGKIAECWSAIVPEMFNDHCSLESYTRGTLTVMVDSASHLYELKQLLLAGLEGQLLLACKSAGLRKIQLRHGRWYDAGDADGEQKLKFDRR
jgi:hypothetical protein